MPIYLGEFALAPDRVTQHRPTNIAPIPRVVNADSVPGAGPVLSRPQADCLHELCALLTKGHLRVLVIGPGAVTDMALALLQSYVHQPIAVWAPRQQREIPNGVHGTLVIRGVDGADAGQQAQLVRWCGESAGAAQVLATAAAPVFPLVTRGDFRADLYYRLNHAYCEFPH